MGKKVYLLIIRAPELVREIVEQTGILTEIANYHQIRPTKAEVEASKDSRGLTPVAPQGYFEMPCKSGRDGIPA